MGKVLATFSNGFPGAVSRSVDDVIIGMSNLDSEALAYGVPVVLDSTGKGAVKFTADSTAADLVGFTVRSASKTPDTYGESVGSYAPGDMMDVLVRGSLVAEAAGEPATGGTVCVVAATGALTAETTDNIALTNVRFRGPADGDGRVEILVTERHA